MILNDPSATLGARRPRGAVTANREPVAGVVLFEVDNNSYYQADTFRLVIAISAQPRERGIAWWLDQDQIEVELFAGFPDDAERFTRSDLMSLLLGYVDDVEVDLVAGEMTITGRDHTSKLIDTKSSLTVVTGQNAIRSSKIVSRIATDAGLTPIITETKEASPAGSYYKLVKQIVESHSTLWDIVSRLAQIEQYVAYVRGNELHFEPRTTASADCYVIRWLPPGVDRAFPLANAMRLRISRNLFIAKDIKVTVLSYDYKNDQQVKAVAQKTRIKNAVTKGAAASSTPPVEYVYHFANMTHSDAQAKANELVLDLSKHELKLDADMPGDSILTSRVPIRVEGTQTRSDQVFYPDSIVRSYSTDDGYRMRIVAKNITPDVEISKV